MNERVVIVGGTSGIGLETARRQLGAGRDVVVTGRDPERLRAALADLAGPAATDGTAATASGSVVDARDETATREFFAGLGRVDHVVVAATGSTAAGPFRSVTTDALREASEGKLIAHSLTARAALDVLSPTGSITFVTAASAGAAMPGTAGLAAVNASVAAMVPVLAVELAPVRFNAVSPGVVDTPWWDWMDEDAKAETFAAYAKSTPAGRCGRPEDIADAISFLVGNSFTTGIVLTVDGGARLASGA
ncbi:SDR family oxidoreductase [Streptomyces sp. NPDC048491]|uniref:SDR family oxidoreductase n=1 Tax=unclassified Streptomyces TaxID=2593676 RepID=UPI001DEFDD89|nr:SDR family oxidoreductase [Streptomyces sp. MAG02]